jgi:HPt (histidine-containing phosphotransfer) domain-containing protein
MPIQSDEREQFAMLIVHGNCPASQMQQLQGIFNNGIVFANTIDKASIAITDYLFNLIIVDLDLGDFDLVSLAKNPSCINRNTPVIALLDEVDSAQKSKLIAAGFDDLLSKPLTADNLSEIMGFWCGSDGLSSFLNSIQTLLANCRNDRSLVIELYKKLFEELPQQIDRIEAALKTRQYQLALDVTHNLNGCVRTCYLQDIEELANALERCLIQKKYEFADGYFLMLQQQVSTFIDHRRPILDHLHE